MVAVRADEGEGEGGDGGELALDFEGVGEDGGGGEVGLDVRGRDEAGGAAGGVGDGDARVGEGGVEGGGLVEAVVEVVEQRVMQAEGGADAGFAVAGDVPGEADAGLGEEAGAVVREGGGAYGWGGVDDAVGERVDSGVAVGLVEAVGGFEADAAGELEARGGLPGVREVAGAEERAPVEDGGRGDDGEGFDGAGEEAGEGGEAGLAVLVLREVVV